MGPNTAIRGGARRWAYLHTLHNNFATDCSSEPLATLRGSRWRRPTVAYSGSCRPALPCLILSHILLSYRERIVVVQNGFEAFSGNIRFGGVP